MYSFANDTKKHLAADVLSFIDKLDGGLPLTLTTALGAAFNKSGLDGVDELIDLINSEIKLGGSSQGLGAGSALEHADAKKPAYLHIFFEDFESSKILARRSFALS